MRVPYQDEIRNAARDHGLDPALVAAVVSVESSFKPESTRFERHYRWLWNVVSSKPYTLPAADPISLPSDFPAMLQSRDTEFISQKTSWGLMQVMGAVAREQGFAGLLGSLLRPEVGVAWGCAYLSTLSSRHGALRASLSAYNAGSPDSEAGNLYADKVLARVPMYESVFDR